MVRSFRYLNDSRHLQSFELFFKIERGEHAYKRFRRRNYEFGNSGRRRSERITYGSISRCGTRASRTDEIIDDGEEVIETPNKTSLDEDLDALEQSVNEYKRAKVEMQRLGFFDYDEYLDYLEYIEKRNAKKSNMEM